MNREESWELLCEWTESDSLRKHMLGVEAAMRAYARWSALGSWSVGATRRTC